MNNDETITLDAEAIKAIRSALLIGLDSYGEVDRVYRYANAMKRLGKELPQETVPLHPTGSDNTIGVFASALRYIN